MAKTALITFKVEQSLAESINRLANKSEFIRSAILQSLQGTCPLCQGTGVLNLSQQEHWQSFSRNHSVKMCGKCQSPYIRCNS